MNLSERMILSDVDSVCAALDLLDMELSVLVQRIAEQLRMPARIAEQFDRQAGKYGEYFEQPIAAELLSIRPDAAGDDLYGLNVNAVQTIIEYVGKYETMTTRRKKQQLAALKNCLRSPMNLIRSNYK
jgi:hypothetical protein